MYSIYSLLLTLGFLLMSPLFLLRREKYASGFKQRLGNYPQFKHDGRKVIWLHCVSVGETNAARPLVDQLLAAFPDHRLVISTTTKTGQDLAQKIFHEKADAVIYFPFDWKFSVRKALARYKPSLVLLMETEIWPRFIREAKLSGAKVAIVNGRLSERSFRRYSKVRPFLKQVLADVDLALMQAERDANHLIALGLMASRDQITGNLKFDLAIGAAERTQGEYLNSRFELSGAKPLIVAASTHPGEDEAVLWAVDDIRFRTPHYRLQTHPRLLIAPRHPERFDEVAKLMTEFPNLSFVRRSSPTSENDKKADVIILDCIGELRGVYHYADIVFVGGSIVKHGGQSVLEPAAEGKAIVTGFYTFNFQSIVDEFVAKEAIYQLPEVWWLAPQWEDFLLPSEALAVVFTDLLADAEARKSLGRNAAELMAINRGATAKTVEFLRILSEQTES